MRVTQGTEKMQEREVCRLSIGLLNRRGTQCKTSKYEFKFLFLFLWVLTLLMLIENQYFVWKATAFVIGINKYKYQGHIHKRDISRLGKIAPAEDAEKATATPMGNNEKVKVKENCEKEVLTEAAARKTVLLINLLPNGILRMSDDIKGLVETQWTSNG